MPIIKTAL